MTCRLSLIVACLLVSSVAVSAAAQESGTGPAVLVLTYRCDPIHRTAFRAWTQQSGVAQFEKWKSEGVFSDYQVMFSSLAGHDTWDMMLVLHFAKYADIGRWKQIEQSLPGGLSSDALRLAVPTTASVADVVWNRATAARDPGKTVYLIIPYQYADYDGYRAFVAAYVIPQYEGWMRAGILSQYTVLLSRHPAGKPWDALILLEYRDLEALAMRDVVKAKVRAELAKDPNWKKASDNKSAARTEQECTIADAIVRR